MHMARRTPPSIFNNTAIEHHLPSSVDLSDLAAYERVIKCFEIYDLLTQFVSVIGILYLKSFRHSMFQMHYRSVEHLCAVFLERLIRLMLGKIHVL